MCTSQPAPTSRIKQSEKATKAARSSATSSLLPRRERRPARQISTLNPSKLVPGDYIEVADGSASFVVAVHGVDVKSVVVNPQWYDSATRSINTSPFPPNTRGFLYLHRPDRSCITSGLRFRLVDKPDPTLFDQGKDLLRPDGKPWFLPLVAIVKRNCYTTLRELVIRSKLVSETELALLKSLDGENMKSGAVLLGSITQPFERDLSRLGLPIRVQEGDKIHRFAINRPRGLHGARGSVLVQLELAYRQIPSAPPKPFVVMRILKFLDPPKYDGPLTQEEGKLIRRLSSVGEPFIWAASPSTLPPPCLKALEQAYPPHPSRIYKPSRRQGQRLSVVLAASDFN
ncbi:hypothetical protein CC1G_04805 [Coprinopsis cinerea okayama7|uniref:Uncharacterized protein n=1 Tax=Coprinopsis cinerea (strain Okayama-7 / 130 / ATCC MYA-4618 / FGSC 9003) TaxID=240176 RepID=A8P2M5_COPC7|nr:hypothetical protein CC1G_04805 [Coprinopsis cinerea okayama7\|eukprot:XP_001838361.1 hypothetical protein CC1G_04805 [Coprinopsis cinerea okayama7\